MQAIVTYCNMHTDAQTFPQPVENPLASLARVMLCITVNILYHTTESEHEVRAVLDLQQILTPPMGDNENHSQ